MFSLVIRDLLRSADVCMETNKIVALKCCKIAAVK